MSYAALIVEAVAIVVAIGIAVWQQKELRRYRKTDEEAARLRTAQEARQQKRLALRQALDPDLAKAKEHLSKLQDVESEVRERGPIDHASINARDLDGDCRRLRNIADRLPEELSEPLRTVAAAADRFRNVHVPAEKDAIDEYVRVFGTTPHSHPSPEHMPFALAAKAIEQYRAATDLHNAIDAAWQALRVEGG